MWHYKHKHQVFKVVIQNSRDEESTFSLRERMVTMVGDVCVYSCLNIPKYFVLHWIPFSSGWCHSCPVKNRFEVCVSNICIIDILKITVCVLWLVTPTKATPPCVLIANHCVPSCFQWLAVLIRLRASLRLSSPMPRPSWTFWARSSRTYTPMNAWSHSGDIQWTTEDGSWLHLD